MVEQPWLRERSKTIVCLDSYHNGVPVGRIYGPHIGVERFNSLSQFLIKMEEILNDSQMPQSYTSVRTFPTFTEPLDSGAPALQLRRGSQATFEMQIIFRQHTSWQGIITWLEERMEQSFRSVLELILLMDSALRQAEGGGSDS